MSHLGSHLGRVVGGGGTPAPYVRSSSAIQVVAIQKAVKDWVVGGSGLAADHVIWEKLKGPRPSAPYIELAITMVTPPSHDWVTKAPNPLVFSALTISAVDAAANTLTSVAHGLITGDGPVRLTQMGGALPSPLAADTDYWVIAVNADRFRLAATFNATGGNDPTMSNPIAPIDLTTAGSGTIKVVCTADTVRAGKELKRIVNGFRELTLQVEVFGVEGSGFAAMSIASDVMTSLPLFVDDLDVAGVGVEDVGVTQIDSAIRAIEGRLGGISEPRAMFEVALFVSAQLETTYARADRVHVDTTAIIDDSTVGVASTWMPSPPP